eukprot:6174242-Pleurochrysis_carterae.AAC.2
MKSSVCEAYKYRLPAITASFTTAACLEATNAFNHCSKKHAYPQITAKSLRKCHQKLVSVAIDSHIDSARLLRRKILNTPCATLVVSELKLVVHFVFNAPRSEYEFEPKLRTREAVSNGSN